MNRPDKKNKITIQLLADELSLSVSTVSRALNDHPRISEKTKKTVYIAAEKHGLFQKEVQKRIVQRIHHTVALLVPGTTDYHLRKLIEGIRSSCIDNHLNLMIIESYKDFFNGTDALHYCYSLPVTGFILYIDGINARELTEININNLPTVLIGNVDINYPYQKIAIDHFMDSYLAVKHLANSGLKRIAFLADNNYNYITQNRLTGFQRALKDFSIDSDSFLIQSSLNIADVEACIQQIMHSGNIPDSYIVERASAAMLLTRRLIAFGIQIPSDIKIVSLEDDDILSLIHPSITSVFSPSYEVGKTAAISLNKKIQDENNMSKNSLIVKSPYLILRNSSI